MVRVGGRAIQLSATIGKKRALLGLLLAGPALAGPEVASERASTGPLRQRL